MTDPHYDGGHALSMAEYYKGYGDGCSFKRTWASEKRLFPYVAGWDRGYEDKGKSMEEAVDRLINPGLL